MTSDLKRELERRIPDSEIPPLALERIRNRGRRLQRRRRAAIGGSGLLAVVVLLGGTLMLDIDFLGSKPNPPAASPAEPSEAITIDPAVSLDPNRLSVGDQAELRVHSRARGTYGLEWILERRQGSSWKWNGYLEAGPGKQWKERFYLPPLSEGDIEDIGFNGAAVMTIEIPKLEPGKYRLRTDFILGGREPLEDRREWHYVEFEVSE